MAQVALAPERRIQNSPSRPARRGVPLGAAADVGSFLVSAIADPQGRVWFGTEDQGVCVLDPAAAPERRWTRFRTGDGLGDDHAYALCCDAQGRIWVGHLNHGVSVFNGEEWRNYDRLSGPLGERVFDVGCCEATGEVWIATNLGLARFTPGREGMDADRWRYVTRADGLPGDQVEAVAFDAEGNAYAGTQCDGIAIAQRAEDYGNWKTIRGGLSEEGYRRPSGAGLPSAQINDLLVARDGTIYIATAMGLARSSKGGSGWEYLRGRDYDDKVRGRREAPPKGWKGVKEQQMATLLPEDYVTCLAEDADGLLWAGFRQQGFVVIDGKRGVVRSAADAKIGVEKSFVTALVPGRSGQAFIGTYGSGIKEIPAKTPEAPLADTPKETAASEAKVPRLPTPAGPPDEAELHRLTTQLAGLKEELPAVWGTYLGDDWATQGDWVGRYGRQYAMLCAMASPLNHDIENDPRVFVRGHVGPHHKDGELLRHWCHRARWDDRRVLYNPILGYRRQADWDDHAEAYPMSHEGPDMWVEVEVPAGLHRVSLYFFNKDGHDGHNRFRDYLVELRTAIGTGPGLNRPVKEAAERGQVLAACRVREFWGGVWHSFAVNGPGRYRLKIGKNDSFNTIVSGVHVDRLTGPPGPRDHLPLGWTGNVGYAPPEEPKTAGSAAAVRAAADLRAQLATRLAKSGGLARFEAYHLLAYRAASAAEAPADLLENWRWDLRLWDAADRKAFDRKMDTCWRHVLGMNPSIAAKVAKGEW